jgi:hypothetical protein
MFLNHHILEQGIVGFQILLTNDGIYYVVDHGFRKSPTKHDRNKLTKTKINSITYPINVQKVNYHNA